MDDLDADDPDELDDVIAAWDEVDREAVEVLRAALGGHQGRPPPAAELASAAARIREEMRADLYPLSWVRSAAALERGSLPDDGAELLLRCASATISPREQTGLEIEEEAALLSLEHADWLAAVIVTVREGAGQEASAEALADAVSHCPVPAADVWSHSERLTALGRMLENPQERLLGGLGHALRLWPELEPALREAAPTEVELDVSGWLGDLLGANGDRKREAERFAPDLGVHVHHGPARLGGAAFAAAAKRSDLIVTTYGIALRDRETRHGSNGTASSSTRRRTSSRRRRSRRGQSGPCARATGSQ